MWPGTKNSQLQAILTSKTQFEHIIMNQITFSCDFKQFSALLNTQHVESKFLISTRNLKNSRNENIKSNRVTQNEKYHSILQLRPQIWKLKHGNWVRTLHCNPLPHPPPLLPSCLPLLLPLHFILLFLNSRFCYFYQPHLFVNFFNKTKN